MKNILAENMLRFGAKNLTDATKQKLEQLAEQTPATPVATNTPQPITDKVVFLDGTTVPPTISKPTLFLDNRDPRTPIMHLLGIGNDSRSVAIAQNGMIYDGRTYPYASNNMADFILKAAEEMFGDWKTEANTVELLTALNKVQASLRAIPGGQIINGMIQSILTNAVTYGRMEQPAYSSAIQKFGGNLVQNNPYAFYNPIRQYLGLPIENAEFMKNPAKRGSVPNAETTKPTTTPPAQLQTTPTAKK